MLWTIVVGGTQCSGQAQLNATVPITQPVSNNELKQPNKHDAGCLTFFVVEIGKICKIIFAYITEVGEKRSRLNSKNDNSWQ